MTTRSTDALTHDVAKVVAETLANLNVQTKVTRVSAELFVVHADTAADPIILPEDKAKSMEQQEDSLQESLEIPASEEGEEMPVDDGAEEFNAEDHGMSYAEATAAVIQCMNERIVATIIPLEDGRFAVQAEDMEESDEEDMDSDDDSEEEIED